MALVFKKTTLIVSELMGVEDAEALLEWLQKYPRGQIDLAACTHVHAADLQVLMAAKAQISTWPQSAPLAAWLRAALMPEEIMHV